MFVFNGDLILLESKWPVNSPIYHIKKLKPSVSIPLKSRKLLFGSAVEFLWCFYYLNSRNNGWVSATCKHYPALWSWKALLWRESAVPSLLGPGDPFRGRQFFHVLGVGGMREPGGPLSTGSRRVRHDWSDLAAAAGVGGVVLGWFRCITCIVYFILITLAPPQFIKQ